jgi:hypothetical protein
MGGAYTTHGGIGEAYAGFWWENLRERDNLEDPGVNGAIKLRYIFRKQDVGIWIGSSWLRIRTGWWAPVNAVLNLRVL